MMMMMIKMHCNIPGVRKETASSTRQRMLFAVSTAHAPASLSIGPGRPVANPTGPAHVLTRFPLYPSEHFDRGKQSQLSDFFGKLKTFARLRAASDAGNNYDPKTFRDNELRD